MCLTLSLFQFVGGWPRGMLATATTQHVFVRRLVHTTVPAFFTAALLGLCGVWTPAGPSCMSREAGHLGRAQEKDGMDWFLVADDVLTGAVDLVPPFSEFVP
mmetsp:Transcript_44431/g.117930  ORF Transcript_44431/g.117930 Transcript_44431/m.117930 type:complete len:102 (-) Transcript_44431:141-446(-)